MKCYSETFFLVLLTATTMLFTATGTIRSYAQPQQQGSEVQEQEPEYTEEEYDQVKATIERMIRNGIPVTSGEG